MHSAWTDRFSAYLDDELPPQERLAVEAHVGACEGCRVVLEELREVVASAPAYRGREPATDLWPAIAAGIAARRDVAFPAARAVGRRFSLAQMAAAAAIVAVVSGGAVWFAVRPDAPAPVVAGGPAPDLRAVTVAQLDDPSYAAAVEELEALLAASRDRLDSATVRVIEENLRVVDAAIAEARAAIEADPSNVHLGGRVKTHMQRKLVLLRQAAWAVGAST